jgi:hypothetical protein
MPSSISLTFVSCVAAVVAAMAVGAGGVLARGSTAVPAAAWAVAAALAGAAEMAARAAGWLADPAAIAAVRLAVAALSLCPTMSLLGAKRPQHGVWQFIVASLACVLALPAASAMLVRPGFLPDVHPLQRWFMPLLVVVGWMNFAATRHGLAAFVVASGQMLLLAGFLPWRDPGVAGAEARDAVGALAIAVGAVIAVVQSAIWPVGGRSRSGDGIARPSAVLEAEITAPFLAIRETLGAAWTLRIAERFNTVAATRGWPCRLSFAGLEAGGDPGDPSWHRDARRAARALLVRFASDDWLRRHGPAPR